MLAVTASLKISQLYGCFVLCIICFPVRYGGWTSLYKVSQGTLAREGVKKSTGHSSTTLSVVSCPAGPAQSVWWQCSDLEAWSSQNIDWPIRIDKLHNHMNVLTVDVKADNYVKIFTWMVYGKWNDVPYWYNSCISCLWKNYLQRWA